MQTLGKACRLVGLLSVVSQTWLMPSLIQTPRSDLLLSPLRVRSLPQLTLSRQPECICNYPANRADTIPPAMCRPTSYQCHVNTPISRLAVIPAKSTSHLGVPVRGWCVWRRPGRSRARQASCCSPCLWRECGGERPHSVGRGWRGRLGCTGMSAMIDGWVSHSQARTQCPSPPRPPCQCAGILVASQRQPLNRQPN